MRKNVSGQKIGAQLVSATDGSAFTGSVTVSVTGDAGTQATGSVGSGACTHEGNGYHTYAPAQAETNYDLVAFTFTGTGAIPVTVQVYTRPTTGILAPATADRTLVVDASGLADCNMVKMGPTGSGTAQTARDIGASVLLSSGTGTGQLDFTSGVVKANATQINGTSIAGTSTQVADRFVTFFNQSSNGFNASTAVSTLTQTQVTGGAYALNSASFAFNSAMDFTTTQKAATLARVTLVDTTTSVTGVATGGITPTSFTASTGLQSITSGTVQSAGTKYVTLESGASSVDNAYKYQWLTITGGTGAGQSRMIESYVGSTRRANVYDRNWTTTPDGTSTYAIIPAAEVGNAQGIYDAYVADELATTVNASYAIVNSGTYGNAALKTLIDAVDDFIDTEVAAIKAKTDYLPSITAGSAGGLFIAGSNAATTVDITGNLIGKVTGSIVTGTVTTGGTTTSIPTSSLSPSASVADQFKGRVVIFDKTTTTTALRGQASDITASTSGGTLTVTALTTAPSSGDTFIIV